MNKKQKICMWLGIAVLVAMTIYPPYLQRWPDGQLVGKGGYSFIFCPPIRSSRLNRFSAYSVIDIRRLHVQYFAVAVVTAGLIVTFKDKKKKGEQEE